MKLFPSPKIFLEIGPLSITWYAMFYLIGTGLVYFILLHRFKKVGYKEKDIELSDYVINTLFVGIIGARIWDCLFIGNTYYLENPLKIIEIWNGGLAIQGGVIAGLAYSIYYMKKRNIHLPTAADVIMPCMLFCQAIGRWGNFINQEAHGGPTTRAFLESLHLPEFVIEGMCINGVYYQPTFLYESILNILGFIIIIVGCHYLQKRKGTQFFAYFIWYGAVRFFIEPMRTDHLMLGSIPMASLTAVLFFIFGILGMIYTYKKGESIQEDEPYL